MGNASSNHNSSGGAGGGSGNQLAVSSGSSLRDRVVLRTSGQRLSSESSPQRNNNPTTEGNHNDSSNIDLHDDLNFDDVDGDDEQGNSFNPNQDENNGNHARSRSASFPSGVARLDGGASPSSSAGATASGLLSRHQSSPRGSGQHHGNWVVIKAKTRQHNSSRVARRVVWYEGTPSSSFSVGRNTTCDLTLDDDRCSQLNALLEPTNVNGVQGIRLTPKARTYKLVGMGNRKSPNCAILEIGSTLKAGSVSLEVTAMCLTESNDFTERFAVELGETKRLTGSQKRLSKRGEESTGNEESEGSVEGNDAGADLDDDEQSVEQSESDGEDAMCYICWAGPEKVGDDGKPDPIIRNPCGKCDGSSKYVHLGCLLQWIRSSGSGHCSICNGPLPQHFSSPPPNLELKVVRHRRGQSWVGTRRFRLSFADKDTAIIGRDQDADVRLSDRSVGSVHAKITFNRETKQFELSDCSSLGGTYLQLKEPLDLLPENPTYLKIGRTLLSLRMTQKRGTVMNMLQSLSWAKR